MARFRFHKFASIVVLAAAAAWVLTGEFSSVGSAAQETPEKAQAEAKPATSVKPPRTVSAIAVPLIDHRLTIRVSGQTAPDKRAELATRSAGTISLLPFKQGDAVKAGDIILDMDSKEKKIAVDAAAQVVKQKTSQAAATEALAKRGNVAKLQLDAVRADLQGAQSQYEAAKAELERTLVIAPYDGIIDKIAVENGSAVGQGAVVATLLSLNPIIAVGDISERNLASIKVGSPADVRLVNGMKAQGTVRYISREANAATRTYRIEVAVDNANGEIPAGMTAEIDLKSDPVKAIKLPRSAVTLNQEGVLGVRAVDKDSKAVFLPVELIDDATNAIILTGVPEGTRIIITGQDFVADGEQLNVIEPDAETLKKLAAQFADELK
ncbi:MAG: efflux RND transporter periplasmic adaptor subunit [Rhizobiaceae bacterium]